jgi:hypothetical protein
MKPHLLALLLAIPIVIFNLVACESVDVSDGSPSAKSESAAKPAPSPSRGAGGSSSPAPKPAPASRSVPAHAKAWFM